MTERMAKLDRILTLVHCLADTNEGLTLDEMAEALGVNRRTAERMRDIITRHFDLDEEVDDRRKRFRIRGSLRRVFTRPHAAEIAALQIEIDARNREGGPQAQLLESLLVKIKGVMDSREKGRLDPDLDPLARLQRTLFQPGPLVDACTDALAAIQQAMVAGQCVAFDYRTTESDAANRRCVVPMGLIHGPITYLVGKLVARDYEPTTFRLDRMETVQMSDRIAILPDDWSLDDWMEGSASIWREEEYDIVLRVLPGAVDKARSWRFHPRQVVEEDEGCLIVRFRSGGLWQIADHVFTWRGDVVIEGPDELRDEMRERVRSFGAQVG